jgi:NAD(P)H dehydrogenase (quinone)
MQVAIIYYSGFGHTKIVAENIAEGAKEITPGVVLLTTEKAMENFDILHNAQALVFGCPTYFGGVAAEFKRFIEATGKFWYKQPWKDKLAAGFTNSSTVNGDKLATLNQLAIFAAQHSMLWVPTGIMPVFENDVQLPQPNGMASYMGLMTLSDNGTKTTNAPADLHTAKLFGKRIAQLASKINN